MTRLLFGVLGAAIAGLGFSSSASAATCTPSATEICLQFTDGGGIGASVPFGQIKIDINGSGVGETLSFHIDVSPNYDLSTGSHHAFSFAIGNALGNLANVGSITSVQAGYNVAVNGTPTSNPPFDGFNYAVDCNDTTGGINPTCGQTVDFVFTFSAPGKLIAADAGIWFAADICIPNAGNTGCSATGVVGAVPGPIAGGGITGLIMACGGLIALARRRRAKLA